MRGNRTRCGKHGLALVCSLLAAGVSTFNGTTWAADFEKSVKPLLVEKCAKCHGGGKKINSDVNLKEVATAKQLLAQPELIEQMIEVISANDMPPESEPPLSDTARADLLTNLKSMLRESTAEGPVRRGRIRRLNRFQYNNCVRDLFALNRNVFHLPEKLMTRNGPSYLTSGSKVMPAKVQVACQSLLTSGGLSDVNSFPKDLRAAHGFDNQANQLTLSPLLLDAFLRLSVSILESPDFNRETVGIWDSFFKEPENKENLEDEVRDRLAVFLTQAFREPVDRETLDRYTAYVMSKLQQGVPFTTSMKKVASATLSSPMFLYRHRAQESQFELASNLSFFLWGSSPDKQLIELAKSGDLAENMPQTIDRMLADERIERFLDTFPSQWMQLENVLAATPDPQKHRYFSFDTSNPASLQMVLEPLLLFDAVFVEDRPITDLIAPEFSYRSEFLKTWYTSDLKPPRVDVAKVAEENLTNESRRKALVALIASTRSDLDAIVKPIRQKLLIDRRDSDATKEPVDLRPYAAWDFDGGLKDGLKDSVGMLDLTAHGEVQFQDGMVVLNKAYLLSKPLPMDLGAKSLEVRFRLTNLDQNGGGLMGLQGPGDFFDTIVIGERKSRHWISGSNGFSRTEDFPESTPETVTDQLVHLVMVYAEDGTTSLFRNGQAYGQSYGKGKATFPKEQSSVIFGLRHLPAGGNRFLSVTIDQARLYDRALTKEEAVAASSGDLYISNADLLAAMSPEQRKRSATLTKVLEQSTTDLKAVPPTRDPKKLQQELVERYENEIRGKLRSQNFERVATSDPRYGGVITSAAMLSMTSGPKRTHPIARGAWIIEVIFNDPPPPPPNDVPPLNEDSGDANLTIREKFAQHRENPDCAGCHSRLDPLGFALENFDITGRWRDKYDNGRNVDSSGTLMKKYDFDGIVRFKESLVKEDRRFAKAFAAHLLRFAVADKLQPVDSLTVDAIVEKTQKTSIGSDHSSAKSS